MGTERQTTDIDYYIGTRLRELRLARRLSMDELSRQLVPSISGQQLQKYETGQNRLSAARLWELATLLEVGADQLLPASDPVTPLPLWTAEELDLVEAFRLLAKPCQQAVQVVVGALPARRSPPSLQAAKRAWR